MNPILLPTDFTADSELAFLLACGIARDRAQELILLHVVNPMNLSQGERDGDQVDRDSALYQSCCDKYERLKSFADGVPLSFQVKIGPSVETIIDVAEREGCSLIIIAAHQHGHLHRTMYGSVTDSLTHRAKCPVVCVNPSPFHAEDKSLLESHTRKSRSEAVLWPRQFQ